MPAFKIHIFAALNAITGKFYVIIRLTGLMPAADKIKENEFPGIFI
jgi:hypothetical protein